MAHVYLSFLGTNNYVPCTYYYGETKIADVRFVQEATATIFCAGWTGQDRLLIFTTEEAKRSNWLDNGHQDKKTGEVIPLEGLQTRLHRLALAPSVQAVDIPEGRSEAEIWQIFQIIFDQIHPGDEVIFDITHAFRSIPMLAMVVLPYARVMKNITIKGIYYGAFEVLGHPAKVDKLPMDQRLAPIFDLTPFSSLLDWTLAIDRFLGAGDAGPACDLARTAINPILRETRGQDTAASAIRQVTSLLSAFSKQISTCRGREIDQTAVKLKQALELCRNQRLLPTLQPLLGRVEQSLKAFRGNAVADGIQAARWCLNHNLIQQGFTLLQETMITAFVLQANNDPAERKHRALASQAVNIYLDNIEAHNWHPPASDHPDLINQQILFLKNQRELANIFRNLSQDRNDLNHAGYVSPSSAEAFAARLAKYLERVEKLLP